MSNKKQCGICGIILENGDQIITEEVAATKEQKKYTRLVHKSCVEDFSIDEK